MDDNFLDNGAVLPHGLLGENLRSAMSGFNKTYKNFPLRIGVVVKAHPVSDPSNHSKLTTEYDVQVIEQNQDQGATSIFYRNCMSAESMGSIADFLEKALRPQKKKANKGATKLNDQDGAIVLLLCLDAMSDKGIIVSSLTHPDRKTKLKSSDPYLEGEYNGINVVVNTDGSTTLTFKGATDNEGKPIDPVQGNTEIKIEKDGSYQVDHNTITFRMDKGGTASLNAKKDVNVTAQGNVTFQVTGNATINTQGNTSVNASGEVNVKSGGNTSVDAGGNVEVKAGGTCDVNASATVNVKAPLVNVNAAAGDVLTDITDPFVDLITGFPTQGVKTFKAG